MLHAGSTTPPPFLTPRIAHLQLANAELRSAAFGEKSAEDVADLEMQLTKMKTERRKMFNVIQELRGNVRVFARIRPFLPDDSAETDAVSSVTPRSEFAL